jgi:DNA polymerase III delta subunit
VQSDVFEILNAVSNKNIKSAIISLEQFFKQGSEDEKSKAIHFSAVLSEQLRNALLIQSALANKLSEAQISSETGWKEGRVYMIKRLAQKISRTQIQDCLSKLEHLDVELKTSTAPPRIFIDLILNKLTV